MVYDPDKREWVERGANSKSFASGNVSTEDTSTNNPAEQATPTPSSTEESATKSSADKEYREIEYNTLTGELSVIPCSDTIKIRVGNTVKVKGIGKYLSGLYFVTNIKRTISGDGYSQTLTLIKTGFGDSLKQAQSDTPETVKPRESEVEKNSSPFNVGDKVKIVGDSATYANASDGVKVPDWVKQQVLTVDSVSKDGTRVRLQPIFSWTYAKFVQKV